MQRKRTPSIDHELGEHGAKIDAHEDAIEELKEAQATERTERQAELARHREQFLKELNNYHDSYLHITVSKAFMGRAKLWARYTFWVTVLSAGVTLLIKQYDPIVIKTIIGWLSK